jgi:recombination protein RecR
VARQVYGSEIDTLVRLLARLPGLGPRSARKAALTLVKRRAELLRPLAEAMTVAADRIVECPECCTVDTIAPCAICRDPQRDQTLIVVVEEVGDLWALERSGGITARYHVLGGRLSPLDGIGPEDLSIDKLASRAADPAITEVLLALNATVEGQSTAHFVADRIARPGLTVSRLAQGVPVGGELDYLDDGTLAAAIRSRRSL